MSKQEIKDWEELYEYVRTKVLGYDENQSLPRTVVLRLKGLTNNKFIANNNIKGTANYSFKVILLTFKFCMPDIQKGLRSISFQNEQHKINYILKIVENNLNTVYLRLKEKNKIKNEIENSSVQSYLPGNAAEYKPSKKSEDKFSNLW